MGVGGRASVATPLFSLEEYYCGWVGGEVRPMVFCSTKYHIPAASFIAVTFTKHQRGSIVLVERAKHITVCVR